MDRRFRKSGRISSYLAYKSAHTVYWSLQIYPTVDGPRWTAALAAVGSWLLHMSFLDACDPSIRSLLQGAE